MKQSQVAEKSQLSQLDVALNYARNGIPVFPCNRKKKPATKEGFKAATTNEDMIIKWWTKNPRALIGAPNDLFTVIDDDSHKACNIGKSYTSATMSMLQREGVIKDTTVKVRTASGGYHYYFAALEDGARRINVLPNIDLLSKGGYTILPDQRNYVCETSSTPWDQMGNLDHMNLESFNYVVHASGDLNLLNFELKKSNSGVYGKSETAEKQARKKAKLGGITEPSGFTQKRNYGPKETINYATGEIIFEMEDGVYDSTTEGFVTEEVPFNEDGTLDIKPGMLTTGHLNWLFNNQKIQETLVQRLGLKLPKSKTKGNLSKSVLPGHIDARPSMGTRWSEDGNRIIIRDFSNFFRDKYNQTDYNVTRLYRCIKYKGYVPRGSGAEHNVWFLRQLYEAGFIKNLEIPSYPEGLPKVKKSEEKILEGFALLCALKSLYADWDKTTLFSDRFCAAWCQIDPSTGNAGKKRLVEMGYIGVKGEFNCSRNSDIWKTAILFIPTEKQQKVKLVSPLIERKKDKPQQQETKDMAGNDMHTSVELRVAPSSYDKLKHFAEDIGIDSEDIPDRSEMFISLMHFGDIQDINIDLRGQSFLLGDLQLDVIEGANENDVLIVTGESPAIEKFYWEVNQPYRDFNKYKLYSDEPLTMIVLCSDYKGDHNLKKLESKLSEYTGGMIQFDDVAVRYETSDNMYEFIYDGKKVEQ